MLTYKAHHKGVKLYLKLYTNYASRVLSQNNNTILTDKAHHECEEEGPEHEASVPGQVFLEEHHSQEHEDYRLTGRAEGNMKGICREYEGNMKNTIPRNMKIIILLVALEGIIYSLLFFLFLFFLLFFLFLIFPYTGT